MSFINQSKSEAFKKFFTNNFIDKYINIFTHMSYLLWGDNMNFIKQISNRTVSISDFNRGLAGRIFDDVKSTGSKVVLKNNSPECVLLSPEEYSRLMDELEDARDLMLAKSRLESMNEIDAISKEDIEKAFNMNFDDIEPLSEDEFEWCTSYLLKASLDFVKRNTKKMWKKGPVYRIEYPEYPERAVQEALVNALIHRDYSVVGSEVHVDIYDNRLEIYSPGGMYDGTFVQDLNPLNVSSTRRNPIIADVFARMDLMERRGSGLRKIIEAYEAEENYKKELKPEFKSTESSFTTILKNLNYDTQNVIQNVTQNVTQSEGQNDGQKLKPSDRREKILEIIKNNPKITAYDLSKQFNVTDRTIKRDLKVLTDKKIIKYVGSAKDGHWEFKQ